MRNHQFFIVCLVFIACVCAASAQWVLTGGPSASNVTSTVVSEGRLYAGTFAGGVFVTTNNGDTWAAANNGLTDPIINCLAAKGTTVFAGTSGGVFRTTDNGATWTEQNTDLTNTEVNALVTYGEFLLAGTNDGVFFSTNNGDTWVANNTGLTNTSISSMVQIGDVVLAGTLNGVFRYDTQTTGPWVLANNGITSFGITALSAAGTNVFAATSEDIFLSKNKGNTWASAGLNSNTFVTSAFVVSPNGMAGNTFVGTVGDGVFRSVVFDYTDISAGLTNMDVRALTISGDFLFAATYGAGVWKRSLGEIVVSSVDDNETRSTETTMLSQNFPNPVYDITTIPYKVARGGRVLIEVYDAVNNRVAVVEDQVQQPGTYTAPLQTLNLSNGVYYYRLLNGNTVETRSLVVLR